VLPGFINAHTHIGDSFLPEAASSMTLEEAFFRPDGYKYRALDTLSRQEHVETMIQMHQEMSSTGTVAHLDFREQGVEGAKRLREAADASGVKSIILSQFNHPPFSTAELEENTSPLPPTALEELKQILSVSDGFSESTMNDLTDPAWLTVRELTEARGACRAIHCLESEPYRSVSLQRTGRGDLARAIELLDPHLIVHLTVADDEEIQYLASKQTPAVLNLRANQSLGLPCPPVAKLLDAGVPLLAGTDNGILNGPDLFRELDALYRLACSQAGEANRPPPESILKMVTSNLSKTVWGDSMPGTVRVGAPADFLELNVSRSPYQRSLNPTATLLTRGGAQDLQRTWIDGKTVFDRTTLQ
jgi:cytosine/adenosine deaminase-related metal-dependent hydrolase